jgi:hypothetical protein
VVDESIVAAPGRIAMTAPKALADDVITISYVAEVPDIELWFTTGFPRRRGDPPPRSVPSSRVKICPQSIAGD